MPVRDAYCGTLEAARLASTSRYLIFKAAASGAIRGQVVAGRLFIERQSLEQFIADRRAAHEVSAVKLP